MRWLRFVSADERTDRAALRRVTAEDDNDHDNTFLHGFTARWRLILKAGGLEKSFPWSYSRDWTQSCFRFPGLLVARVFIHTYPR